MEDGHAVGGNPLDVALWDSPAADPQRAALARYRRLATLPFDHERRLVSVLTEDDRGNRTTWIAPIFIVKVPAWIWLGLWFLNQLIEGSFGLFNARANGGGVAFFAHVGGFVFGLLITRLLVRAGQATPQARYADSPL